MSFGCQSTALVYEYCANDCDATTYIYKEEAIGENVGDDDAEAEDDTEDKTEDTDESVLTCVAEQILAVVGVVLGKVGDRGVHVIEEIVNLLFEF